MIDYNGLYKQYIKRFKLTQNSKQAVGLCPFHDDKNPSFSMNLDTGLYFCHSCGAKGNAYQFAVAMNHTNPKDWIDDNPQAGGMLVGTDDQGRLTFPYFDEDGEVVGIKHHKGKNGESPDWEGDGTCKWYGLRLLRGFDRNKPLYICEGEKDCLRMLSIGFQVTTGSAGAGSIPKDLSPVAGFIEYIIIYDNDKAGNEGAEKLAERMVIEFGKTVKIAQWHEGLPKGYDISDDAENEFKEVDYAIANAKEYIPPKKGYTLITMEDFQNMKDTLHKPKMVIEEIASVGGLTLLSGTDNSGKSMMSNQLALCTATGNDFLDYRVCHPYKTVILSLENDDGEQRDRFEKQIHHFLKKYPDSAELISNNLFHRIDIDEGKKFLNAWDRIFDTLKENPDVEVLIVDNLTSTSDVKFSDNDSLTDLIREIEWTARKNKVAIICLCHHVKKESKESHLHKEMIRGGKSLTDFSWNVVQIHPSSIKQEWILFKITKIRHIYSDGGLSTKDVPQLVVFDTDSLLYDYRRAIPNEAIHFLAPNFERPLNFIISLQGANNTEQIWETKHFLNEGNEQSPPIPESTVKKWLPKMVKWCWLKREGQGLYKINWNVVLDLPLV